MTAGLCALLPAAKASGIDLMQFLPKEEKVQVRQLANGVTTFIQENSFPAYGAALRVIMQSGAHEGAFFSLDTSIKDVNGIEEFFSLCRENCRGQTRSEIVREKGDFLCGFQGTIDPYVSHCVGENLAVIAVGDFPVDLMQAMIEDHFGGFAFSAQAPEVKMPIQVGLSSLHSGVALHLDYPVMRSELKTYADLKESWMHILAQDLLQQRLERLTRSLRENWVHPHPRFIYPVHGFALASEESSSNVLSCLLWEVEQIKLDGFNENEFATVREKTAYQLHHLARNFPCTESSKIASFYADGFRSGRDSVSYESFVQASEEIVPMIKFNEIEPYINDLLVNSNRLIHVRYPKNHRSKLLTSSEIEEMMDKIAGLADFEAEAYYEEDDVMLLDNRSSERRKHASRSQAEKMMLTDGDFDLQERIVTSEGDVVEVDPFDTLPISNNEREIISYIITNMAEKNIFELAFDKKKMEDKGKRIHHVHPLRFMGHICSNHDLKRSLKRIKKSSFKWDAFIDGFAKRMKEESSRNNLMMYVCGFAKEVNANPDKVTYYIQKKDWEGLVRYLM